jgi:hypothetical protein
MKDALACTSQGRKIRRMILSRRHSDELYGEDVEVLGTTVFDKEQADIGAIPDQSLYTQNSSPDGLGHNYASESQNKSRKRKFNPFLASASVLPPAPSPPRTLISRFNSAVLNPGLDKSQGLGILNHRDDTFPFHESIVKFPSPSAPPHGLLTRSRANIWGDQDISDALNEANNADFMDHDAGPSATAAVASTADTMGSGNTLERFTSMEIKEAHERMSFHAAPLEVEGGVAVTEEVVELHVADVITQL